MSVLVLAQMTNGTGNRSTALRIREHLQSSGFCCFAECATAVPNVSSMNTYITERNIKCIIGIHAFRVGQQLIGACCPFIVVFGGTDLNECWKVESKMVVMTSVVAQCRCAIAFSNPMKKQATQLWPTVSNRIVVIPQGVNVSPSSFTLKKLLETDGGRLGIEKSYDDMIVFLLVTGLRKVKDPMYLTKVISDWHQEDRRVYLFIIGPKLDEDFANDCRKRITRLPGVVLLPAMDVADLHGVIKSSFAAVNSSLSEGMPSAVIEAMLLGTPVIARNNEGCADLIRHRETGLLFNTAEEFRSLGEELLGSPSLRSHLISNAITYASIRHDVSLERHSYQDIVGKVLKPASPINTEVP